MKKLTGRTATPLLIVALLFGLGLSAGTAYGPGKGLIEQTWEMPGLVKVK